MSVVGDLEREGVVETYVNSLVFFYSFFISALR